jgi:dTDP-4-dehydrorhamnose 3,5-epimerase
MLIAETALSDVLLIRLVRHCDARGFFAETFREDIFAGYGIKVHLVQEDCSEHRH